MRGIQNRAKINCLYDFDRIVKTFCIWVLIKLMSKGVASKIFLKKASIQEMNLHWHFIL